MPYSPIAVKIILNTGLFIRVVSICFARALCVFLPPILLPPFRVHGEPSFLHAFLLLEDFQDAPEAGTAYDAQDRAQDAVLYGQAGGYEDYAGQGEGPPAFRAEMIFALDDYRVEKPDYQKCRHRYYESCEIHDLYLFFSLRGKDNSLFTNPGLHFLKKQYIRADVVGNGHQTSTLRRRIGEGSGLRCVNIGID